MAQDEADEETALFPERIGDRLRAARVKAGLELSDVATRTRVPLRHLAALEAGDYNILPAPTYSIGFAKSFARAVGIDEQDAAQKLRDEMGHRTLNERVEAQTFEDEESGPLAPRWLAWTLAGIVLLLALGYGAIAGKWFEMPSTADVAETDTPVAPPPLTTVPAPTPAANLQGQVVLTAKEAVWLRIYDAKDKVLFEKEMAAGERYDVPRDAEKPMIRTGRADLLAVTIDGKDVAALGPAERTIKDVGISAEALAARIAPPPAATNAAMGASNGSAPATQP
jgi:cytoskeleton protein RodZ